MIIRPFGLPNRPEQQARRPSSFSDKSTQISSVRSVSGASHTQCILQCIESHILYMLTSQTGTVPFLAIIHWQACVSSSPESCPPELIRSHRKLFLLEHRKDPASSSAPIPLPLSSSCFVSLETSRNKHGDIRSVYTSIAPLFFSTPSFLIAPSSSIWAYQ